MRLDKFISHGLNVSRSQARDIIQAGRIQVNRVTIRQIKHIVDVDMDQVFYNSALITYKEFWYFMLHKPQGVLSATKDASQKTVIDLLQEEDKRANLSIIGRLDKDTEGLILLTSNKSLVHTLTSPKKDVIKEYYCEVEGTLTEEDIIRFAKGVEIILSRDETYITKPARLEIIEAGPKSKAYVYITEGKFHQVKKMFLSCGKEVTYLKRNAIGNIRLDEDLKLAEYRELTKEEIQELKKHTV